MSEPKNTGTKASSLQEREMDLRITVQGTTIKIELPMSSTGRPNEMPFAAVDQQKKEDYLTNAQNRLTDRLVNTAGPGGYNVDKVTGGGEAGGDIKAINVKFNSAAEANRVFADKDLLRSLQSSFDGDRKQEYMKAAEAWTRGIGTEERGGGASVAYNGKQVKVTDNVAYNYYQRNFDNTPGYADNSNKKEVLNDLNRLVEHRDRFEAKHRIRSSADELGSPTQTVANNLLSPGNDRINKHFEQALKGSGGDKDAAAVAVDTISKTPGFKSDQDISVMQGRNGLIVAQGEGPTGLALQVPQAKPGDFEKVAAQMAAQPQQTQQVAAAQPTEQQERKPLSA